jgi:putative DNA primase/helicase
MDLNDLNRKGIPIEALLDTASALPPILPADLGRSTDYALAQLAKLQQQVAAAQDKDEQTRLILEFLGDQANLRAGGIAYHTQESAVKVALAKIRTLGSLSGVCRELEGAFKSEARTVKRQEQEKKASAYGGTVTDLPPGSGGDGLKAPPGWLVNREGVFEATGAVAATAPVLLTHKFRDIETGKVRSRLAWLELDKWRHLDVEHGQVMNARRLVDLVTDGVPTSSGSAAKLVQYFDAFQMHNRHIMLESIGRMGWVDDSMKTFMVGYEAVGDEVVMSPDPTSAPHVRRYTSAGTWDGWVDAVRTYMTSRPLVMAGVYASLAAPLIKLLGVPGFVVDWSWETGRGKSKSIEAAASVWGGVKEGQGVWRRWKSGPSTTAHTHLAWLTQSVPLMLDETKDMHDRPDIVRTMLYQYAGSESTLRGTVTGGIQLQKEWHSILLSTGEAPITSFSTDHGANARCLLFQGPPFGDVSVENGRAADAMREALELHHGHAGPRFIRHLMSIRDDWDGLRERYKKHRAELMAYGDGPEDSVHIRRLKCLAVMSLAAEIASDALGVPGDWRKVIRDLYDLIKATSAEADAPRIALDLVWSWTRNNEKKFRGKGVEEPSGGWLGEWNDEEGVVAYDPGKLEHFLKERKHDAAAVKKAWQGRGWLETDKNNMHKKYGRGHIRPRMLVIKRWALQDDPRPGT